MRSILTLLAMSAAFVAAAPAAAAESVDGCVDLSAQHQAYRFGSQYVLVKDGDAHYRLGFNSCGDIGMATRFELSAEDTQGRMCAAGTKVRMNTGTCIASSLERIDETTFQRLRRRR